MIDDIYILILVFIVGVGLGIFYFGGLWLTVKRIPDSQRRILLVIGSFLVRSAVCLGVIVLIARGGHWERVAICMLGLIISRMFLIQRLQPGERNYSMLKGKIKDEYQS